MKSFLAVSILLVSNTLFADVHGEKEILEVPIEAMAFEVGFEPSDRQKEVLDLALNGEGSFYKTMGFVSQFPDTNGCDLYINYVRFGKSKGKLGAIAISSGFTEAALKYTELADDLIRKGYSPIYVINHRGQGNSDRVLVDPSDKACVQQRLDRQAGKYDKATRHKGFVEDFYHYVQDFDDFVKDIIKRDGPTSAGLVDPEKFYLMAHSMGGAVALNYLMRHKNPFSKVILSSPMLKVVLPKIKEWMWKSLNTFVSRAGSNWGALFGKVDWTDYAIRKQREEFTQWGVAQRSYVVPEDDEVADSPLVINALTSDKNRYWFHLSLLAQHPDDLPINGPTYGWVHEALDGTERGFNFGSNKPWTGFYSNNTYNSVTKKPKDVEILLFQATADTVVDNSGQGPICRRLAKMKANNCKLIPFSGAHHEIFIEQDHHRNEAITLILQHFQ